MAIKGERKVYVVIFNEGEWLTIWTTVHATWKCLSNFYIFKGKRKTKEYVANVKRVPYGQCRVKA